MTSNPMARPRKNNADYFSHDADASMDEKIIYLESKFGMAGYAFYFKTLEALTRSENFIITNLDEIKMVIYAKRFGIAPDVMHQMITESVRIKAFTKDDNNNIFSEGLIKRMNPLIEARKKDRSRKGQNNKTEVFHRKPLDIRQKENIFQVENPQSKVKERIEKQSKLKNRRPDFLKFFIECNFCEQEFDQKIWRGFKIPEKSRVAEGKENSLSALDEFLRKMELLLNWMNYSSTRKKAEKLLNEIAGFVKDFCG